MEFDSGIPMSRPPVTAEVSSSLSPPLNEDALWQLKLRSRESMESGPYPVREGEPDCLEIHKFDALVFGCCRKHVSGL
ncbi:unnamed protein product [Lactuca virosa]|uniref:Uncharacterized protein n=1 Tax=Lactuca virosa TaxID=75947 RepID=A0AAU9MT13_9ASTR|nr:unnamed protein product [Lactuca virosa]